MINQQLVAIDTTIKNAQSFRSMLKEKLNHFRTTNQNIEIKENKVGIKAQIDKIKTTTNQLRQELNNIKKIIPKSFSEFLPTEFHHFLRQPLKQNNTLNENKPVEKVVKNKVKSSAKENIPMPQILITKQPIKKQPIIKQPTIKQPTIKQPFIKQQPVLKQNKPQTQTRPASTDLRLNQGANTTNLPNSHNDILRNKIYRELQQLKGLEKRQNTFRMLNYTNKSNRSSVSTVKRRSDQLILGVPINQNSQSKTSKALLNLGNQTQSELTNSNITVQSKSKKPISIPNSPDSLYCPNKHEYYSGKMQNDLPQGNGRLTRCCDKIPIVLKQGVEYYNGGFQKGKFHGFGTLTIKGGIRFVGTFKDGMRQGEGSLYYGGKVEVGRWKNDQFVSNI